MYEYRPRNPTLINCCCRKSVQLCSGWCSHVNSHWVLIDEDERNVYPAHVAGPHITLHLFSCLVKPTHLTHGDLWQQTENVARTDRQKSNRTCIVVTTTTRQSDSQYAMNQMVKIFGAKKLA